ncbi:MAG TPA: glycosyl hydrolase family 8 [Longimicrobium sp.]|jgi:endo-1,4-beta-D-glucanase Y
MIRSALRRVALPALALAAACGDGEAPTAPSALAPEVPAPRPDVLPAVGKYAYACGTNLAPDQGAANEELRRSYAAWKAGYVTASGAGGWLRVTRGAEGNYDTVSEGIGYGMLLAAYLGDKYAFDQLWGYARSHFNARGLMKWKISSGNVAEYDDAATDADEDMALALVAADRKWGGYGSAAQALLDSIAKYEVESGTYVLKPGDQRYWGGSEITNPSYFAPAFYKVFRAYSGDAVWDPVTTKVYEMVSNLNTRSGVSTGLLPDWMKADGTAAADPTKRYQYFYDASRSPWRLAKDAAWYCDTRARSQLDRMNAFFAGQGAAGIKEGYELNGTPLYFAHKAVFVATAAAGALHSASATYRADMWTETVSRADSSGYFNNVLRLLSILFMSGNMPSPLDLGAARPLVDDFESGSVARWWTFNDPGTSIARGVVSPAAFGYGMKVDYAIASYGGVGTDFSPARDWSGQRALEFWFKGTGSGNTVRVEVQDNRAAGSTTDTAERWEYRLADTSTGWRYVSIPWSAFTRRADWQPAGAPNDGFNRTQVWGLTLAPLAGSGSFQVDGVQTVR